MMSIKGRVLDYLKNYEMKKSRVEIELERTKLKNEIELCIRNWNQYQKNIDMVSEEELVSYFAYMIKAEESRLAYLQKQYKVV